MNRDQLSGQLLFPFFQQQHFSGQFLNVLCPDRGFLQFFPAGFNLFLQFLVSQCQILVLLFRLADL